MRGTQRATADSRVGTVIADGSAASKLHVSPIERPLVVLLEHHGADQSNDGCVLGRCPRRLSALISAFSRSKRFGACRSASSAPGNS